MKSLERLWKQRILPRLREWWERNIVAAAAIAPAVPGFGQLAAPLLGAAGEYFDDVSATLVKTLRDNGGVRLVLNGRPYIVSGDDVERIIADIRVEAAKRAQKKEEETK